MTIVRTLKDLELTTGIFGGSLTHI